MTAALLISGLHSVKQLQKQHKAELKAVKKQGREAAKTVRKSVKEQQLRTRLLGIYRLQLHRADDNKPENGGPKMVYYSREEFLAHALIGLQKECPYCKKKLTLSNFQCDHILPISRAGEFELLNTQFTCYSCNQQKGKLTHSEFSDLLALLETLPTVAATDIKRRLSAGGKWVRG